jgi:3,4-dihydroxy 2-butanone 4-phosphate synthase/GTP cyclohydrolase II
MELRNVEVAMERLRQGRMVIMVDDEDRENEGDLVIASQFATPEAINFMARYGRGLICLTIDQARAKQLDLSPMVPEKRNKAQFGTNFTNSIEAAKGVSTGISAADRATTILAAIADEAKPEDIVSPGHVFPIIARKGGVLVRTGQTEGSVDLARLAGLKPSGVICEIMNEDGTMSRRPQLEVFAKEHDMPIVSVAELIAYRLTHGDTLVRRAATAKLPTEWGGAFDMIVYENDIDHKEHLALIKGTVDDGEPVMVRVHSECMTGDIFGSLRCDCGPQLHEAMRMIEKEGRGVVLYLRQEGRGIGITNKIKAYHLQENGADTVEANLKLGFAEDLRDYGIGAQILADLGLKKLRLMTNNPKKVVGLVGYGMEVLERVQIEVPPQPFNIGYMRTKKEKMGHNLLLTEDGTEPAPLFKKRS